MKAALPIALLLISGVAYAAEAPAPAPGAPAGPPSSLSGVDVTVPRDAPNITSTYPAQGSAVAPGILVLTVNFDQRMLDGKGSYAKGPEGEMPECLAQPLLRADAKTFMLLCRTLPGKTYEIAMNAPPDVGFANVGRRAAAPYTLKFSTTTGEPVVSLPAAMRAAKLPENESPIRELPRRY